MTNVANQNLLPGWLEATPSPTATPTPPPSAGCAATYRLVNQWQGGFQGEVTVRNSGTAALSGWTARFAHADGQRITQAWNATVTQDGTTVTARNVGWNGTLAPGAQATFGFLASSAGTNTVPAVGCTAG